MEQQESQGIIVADNIFKIYDMGAEAARVNALNGVSLSVRRGEFLSIMGASGSGKTTLLDVLSCMHRPTRGEVYIKGHPVSQMNETEFAHTRGRTIGFIFQTFNLIPRLTAVENVMLPLWFAGVPRNERDVRAKEILAEVGLKERMNHKPMELSGGQRQRVAIARALAVNPEVIVADEPTGNLDSKTGKQILEIVKNLNKKKKKTVVMVTHEESISKQADRTIYLRDGKIVSNKNNA